MVLPVCQKQSKHIKLKTKFCFPWWEISSEIYLESAVYSAFNCIYCYLVHVQEEGKNTAFHFFKIYVMWYLLPPPPQKKSKKAADTFNTDVNQCIFTSTAICHRAMLLLLPVLCSVLRFVREVKPTLAPFNTFSLTCGLRQVCFFSLTRVCYFGFLDSISLVLSAHWGNPDSQLGSSESRGDHCAYVSVCNDWVMSGGKGWLLPPSVPTFNVWSKRKEDKVRQKQKESGRKATTWPASVQRLN